MSSNNAESRILIVDDTPGNIEILATILGDQYNLSIATNGLDALAIARAKNPDLILLDIVMPEMDGFQVCKMLKEDPATANISLVFVTAKSDPADEARGFALGAVDFFTKPVSRLVVLARVHSHLELRRQKKALEKLSKAKSEFLANMSHEIRSPMNAIMGMTELTLNTQLTEEQRTNLEIVHNSSQTLLGLINDILDFSKIEAGKLRLEEIPFDLRGQVENACQTMAVKAHQKDLELYCRIAPNIPETLLGDPLRLTQVLINLINNAIKFTQLGEIIVQVKPMIAKKDGDEQVWLRVMVQDTGIGIPADRVDHIFERFSQVDGSTTRQFGGTRLDSVIW